MIAPRGMRERFDLIFETSSGAMIAALLAPGYAVAEIHKLYRERVLTVMNRWNQRGKSKSTSRIRRSGLRG